MKRVVGGKKMQWPFFFFFVFIFYSTSFEGRSVADARHWNRRIIEREGIKQNCDRLAQVSWIGGLIARALGLNSRGMSYHTDAPIKYIPTYT